MPGGSREEEERERGNLRLCLLSEPCVWGIGGRGGKRPVLRPFGRRFVGIKTEKKKTFRYR